MTSFEFIFDYVPEPVYQTTKGKWSSSLPAMISSQACTIALAISGFKPNSRFALAADFFKIPNALITGTGIRSRSPPILKFYKDRCVYAPQYLSAGTCNGPNVSDSSLNFCEDANKRRFKYINLFTCPALEEMVVCIAAALELSIC